MNIISILVLIFDTFSRETVITDKFSEYDKCKPR